MPRTKTTTAAKAAFKPESATILSAMQRLIPQSKEERMGQLNPDAKDELQYLMDRLEMNADQVRVLTAICLYNAARNSTPCDMGDMSRILGLHPLQVLGLQDEINHLEQMGYLNSKDQTDGWVVEPKAMAAMSANRKFDLDELKYSCNYDFMKDAYHIVKNGMCHDSHNTIVPAITRLMQRNTHLPVVKGLSCWKGKDADFWGMLLFVVTLGIGGDDYIDTRDLEQILTRVDAQRILRACAKDQHPFVKQGLIEPYGRDGMAQAERWVLTRKGWSEALRNEEDVELFAAQMDEDDNKLTAYTSLKPKQLFFTPKTETQLARLNQLLQQDQYARIRQALEDKGMPTGFCCLLYGTPGTGKTEYVQQLAIATGRDIMQVNISTLRDKYVGESEKRLQAIFDNYRLLVKKREKAPILFFNEADAIFGNRMENTQHSVDKMENAMQNIILQEMEKLEGILICTTNLTSNLDKAFDRRFLYKVEFERPSNEARLQIWKSLLTDLTDEQAAELASRYDFSGGQIQNISRKQIINSIFTGSNSLDYGQIQEDCKAEKLSRDNGHKIGF